MSHLLPVVKLPTDRHTLHLVVTVGSDSAGVSGGAEGGTLARSQSLVRRVNKWRGLLTEGWSYTLHRACLLTVGFMAHGLSHQIP